MSDEATWRDLLTDANSVEAAQTERARATITLREFGTAAADGLTSDERDILYDRFKGFVEITYDWRTGRYALKASHFVGVLQIGDLRIRIEPKCPASNFFYMLSFAHKLKIDWNDETRLDDIDDILELVVRKFVEQMERLVRRGIYRTYRSDEDSHPFLRGRLMVAEQLRRETTAPGRFAQHLHEYTSDVVENRILVWTLHKLARLPWRDRLLNRRIRRLEQAFDEVALVPVREAEFTAVVYTRLNENYRSPHRLARLLLQMRSIEGTEGARHFSGWLLDMNRLFENFVGVYLQEFIAQETEREYRVQLQGTLLLDEQRKETANPDIQIMYRNAARAVIDTKHKVLEGRPKEEDRRQLLEYANNLRLRNGYLVYSSGTAEQISRGYRGGWSFALHSIVWDLDGSLDELRQRCQNKASNLLADIRKLESDVMESAPAEM